MFKKLAAVLICVMIFIGIANGCTNRNALNDSENGNITLEWFLPAETTRESSKVWNEFNKELAKELNGVTVNISTASFSEFAERWSLMMASKERVDLAWTGYALSFLDEIKNGSYITLNELLDEYGKELKEEIPEWGWKKQEVGGKIYAVPNMQQETSEGVALFLQKELVDKYMDKEKVEATLNKGTYVTKEGWDALGEYLETLKQNGEIREGISTGSVPIFLGRLNLEFITGNFVINIFDEKPTIYHLYETPQMMLTFDVMADWYKKGYIRKDVGSLESSNQFEFMEDGSVIWAHNYFKGTGESYSKAHFFDIDTIQVSSRGYISSAASATATAIPMTAVYPKEAMQLLNYINTEKGTRLYNMLVNGIEGEHYIKVSENRIERIRDEKKKPLYMINRWVIGNTFRGFEYEDGDPVGWNDYLQKEVHANAVFSKLLGFKADISEIRNELVHVSTVEGEYARSLLDGMLADHKSTYNTMMNKLETAGMNTIKSNLQSQIDAWFAENGI
jgi:putative aldouronate transport system substrate-binding protein